MKFEIFQENLKALLASIHYVRGVTLEYVIREVNVIVCPSSEVPEPDVNNNVTLVNSVLLSCPDFNRDDANVFTILRVIIITTPGWNVISKHYTRRKGR